MGESSLTPLDPHPFTTVFHISLAYKRNIDLMQSPERLLHGSADSDIFVLWALLI